jgi:hypothetical protein
MWWLKMIDKDSIQQARQADLAKFLMTYNVPLVRCGHRYKHKEHDSLVFTKNSYYWNSQQETGNSIDYVTKYMGMSFTEAVQALNRYECEHETENIKSHVTFKFDKIDITESYRKTIAYLNKTRQIDIGIIQQLINERYIMQEEQTNNAVFLMYNKQGQCVGAELEGTLSKIRYKGIASGSEYGYGFNICILDETQSLKYVLFFESAIDLLSFMDCKLNHEKKSLNRCILISMSGLKLNIIKHTLETFSEKLQPVLCVDNDTAGQSFLNSLKHTPIDYIFRLPNQQFKDWNEQLVHLKTHSAPIQRLLNRNSAENHEPTR